MLRHWLKPGDKYGLLRKYFGDLFVKTVSLFEKSKEKLSGLLKNKESDPGGDRVMKKLISKSITLAKKFFGIAMGRMVDHLKSSVFNAAGNLMEQFFGEANLKTLLEDKVE